MSSDQPKPPVRKRTRPVQSTNRNAAEKAPEGEFQVGYGKPPVATRFRRGQSGNPRGRPKGARNHETVVNAVLGEKIAVTLKGKTCQVSVWEGVVRRQAQKALDGDSKAFLALQRLFQKVEARSTPKADMPSGPPTPAEVAILDIFMDIAREASRAGTGTTSGEED